MKNTNRTSIVMIAVLGTFLILGTVAQAAEPFLGQIQMFGFNFPPRGWTHCNGQILPINQNTALFSLLGTTFGGDGRTTFGLPDLRGRVALHPGSGPGLPNYNWGQKGGQHEVALTVQNLPSHTHSAHGTDSAGDQETPGGHIWAQENRDDDYSSLDPPDATMNPKAIGNTGGNVPFNNMPPFLGIYHSIALTGIYPSRS